jgi:hypothetical protein
VAEAGPAGTDALKRLKAEIDDYKRYAGMEGNVKTHVEAYAGEERMSEFGVRDNTTLGWWKSFATDEQQITAMEQHFTEKYKREGLDDEHAKAKAAERISTFTAPGIGLGRQLANYGTVPESMKAAYRDAMTEYEKDMEGAEQKRDEKADLRARGVGGAEKFRTNWEKLNDDLKDIEKLKTAQAYDLTDKTHNDVIAGRATEDALEEYKRAQHGGAVGMAGAYEAHSREAYAVVAGAQMGAAAEDSTEKTNELLEHHFPDLIAAVKALQPHWREADGPT